MVMPSATPELTKEVLEDFRQETVEQFQRSEQLLIELERQPQDKVRLRELFRLIHTIKGNLGYVGLDSLMPLPQALEELLGRLREGSWSFDNLLGDILLLTLDRLRRLIDEALGDTAIRLAPANFGALCRSLQALAAAPAARQQEIRRALLQHLDPHSHLQPLIAPEEPEVQGLLSRHGIATNADLLFFAELMQASERRSQYWQGRGLRQLGLALAINESGGRPEPPTQLAAAVCLHDLGMAFLPLGLLHKAERLNREERQQMQSHPRLAFDLLRRMPDWAAAGEIVLQHQEHADGSGYPKGLKEVEITPGALILNIVDTFDARTHERAHQTLSKRPLLRAILEINGLAGSQFSTHWVEVFNRTLQRHPELAHR